MPVIAVCSPIITDTFKTELARLPDVSVTTCPPGGLAEAARSADGIVMLSQLYTADLATALTRPDARCRFIQLMTAGYEPLLEHGVPAGVRVCNAGDVWSPIVAEHTMALLLSLARRMREVEAAQRRAEWDNSIRQHIGMLYAGEMLIVGMGSIGREVAHRARAFGMRVTGVTRSGAPNADADRMLPASRLHEALAEADAIVIAVPYSDATRNLIGAAELAACRPDALIVNVARGAVVDPAALAEALAEGRIGGAGLDVTEPEPLPPESPLWKLPNAIISPHIGGAAPGRYYLRLVEHVVRNAAAFAAGGPLAAEVAVPPKG